jgi:hypothetical protein
MSLQVNAILVLKLAYYIGGAMITLQDSNRTETTDKRRIG